MLSGLAVASDGAVWFAMLRSGSLGRLTDGWVDVFRLPREWRATVQRRDRCRRQCYVGMLPVRYARR
jgi:virginiamycin B lyase